MPTPRTTLRRLPDRGSHERSDLDAILDEGFVGHVAFVHDGQPMCIPTGYVRDGDRVLLHGSKASRMMQALAAGGPVCVTVTLVDGLVLARSGFHHSMNYRSAVLLGTCRPILDRDAKWQALRTYVDRLLPGRWDSLRPMTEPEASGTTVVELPIQEFSVKRRSGPPKDDPEDADWPVWAGVIPLRLQADAPEQDPAQSRMEAPAGVASWSPASRQGMGPRPS